MAAIGLLFFFSGFSALVYELLWMRQIGFIFGNTVHAATTVLTAYMAGLAAGAHLFGRRAARSRRPVALFGLLELTIGASALAMPLLFAAVRLAYRLAYRHLTDSLYVLTPLRFVLALLILAVPTLCMGGSLPVLAKGLLRREENFGERLGLLYGINTLGAAAGILLCGFVLIPSLGLNGSNAVAVASNAAVGLAALALSRRQGGAEAGEPAPAPAAGRVVRIAVAAAAVSGGLALAMEVIWFRALILVFGSTTYSFSVMLSVFLLGIAGGSMAFGWLLDRVRRHLLALSLALTGIGLSTLWSMHQFNAKPEFLLRHLLASQFSWAGMTAARFMIAASLLVLPTLLFGFAFTAAAKVVRHGVADASRAVGRVYTWNTVGAMIGSLAGGFVLLPLLGMEKSLLVLAAAACTAGLVVGLLEQGSAARAAAVLGAVAALAWAGWSPPRWSRELMAAGAYFSPWNYVRGGRVTLRDQVQADRLLYYGEGVTATVSATRALDEKLYLAVDGKVEADTGSRGMVVQRMIGHLPMLFHPAPRRVMNLGLGAGVTFGALSCYPLDRLEVVEIEPLVKQAAAAWGPHNHGIVDRADALFTINDGRNHLFCTPQVYDVITSDPFEPVVGGASHLFTVEHFRQARERLAEDGIMCQWVPMYELSKADYLTILRSFVEVFPRSAFFFTGADSLMLGFKGEMKLDPAVVRAKFQIPAVRASLAEVGFMRPEMILGMFVADLSKSAGFVGPGPLNTDVRPVIEFSAPKSALHFTADANQQVMLDNFTAIPESFLQGFSEEDAKRLAGQHEALRLTLRAGILRAAGDHAGALALLMEAQRAAPENPVVNNEVVAMLMQAADSLLMAGRREEAARQYQLALQQNPTEFWALFKLVTLAMEARQVDFAGQVLNQGLSFYPESPVWLALRGKYRASTGDVAGGLADARAATAAAPRNPGVWKEYAIVAQMVGDEEGVRLAQEQINRLSMEW